MLEILLKTYQSKVFLIYYFLKLFVVVTEVPSIFLTGSVVIYSEVPHPKVLKVIDQSIKQK